MEPIKDIVSPKPVKQYSNQTYRVRKNYYNRLRIDDFNNQDIPHPKSSTNIDKQPMEIVKEDKEQKIKSSDFPRNNWVSEEEKKSERARKELKLDFNFFEDITYKEGQDEIFSILRDFNDQKGKSQSFNDNNTPISSQSTANGVDDKDFDTDSYFQRVSLPPIRPGNPFFNNFNEHNDKEILEALDNFHKSISEDF